MENKFEAEARRLGIPLCIASAEIPMSLDSDGKPASDKTLKGALEREDGPDELGCYCMMRHFNAMLRQSKYNKVADPCEACNGCEKAVKGECHLEWEWNIMPIAKKAGLGPAYFPPRYEEDEIRCT